MNRKRNPALSLLLWLVGAFLFHPYSPVAANAIVKSDSSKPTDYRAMPNPSCDDTLSDIRAPILARLSEEHRDGYNLSTLRFQSPLPSGVPTNDSVYIDLYSPLSEGKHPAVIILHNLLAMADARFERNMAAYLARSGNVAAFMDLPYHLRRTPPKTQSGELFIQANLNRTTANVKQSIADAAALVRWLSLRPDIDPKRIGAVGVSIGGFIVHLLMGRDSRIKAGVTFVAGGDVADLLWNSDAGIAHSVKHALERQGITRNDTARALAEIEPTAYAACNSPRSVLMINGEYDMIVPRICAVAMIRALNDPPHLWLPTNHFGIALLPDRLYGLTKDYLSYALNGVKYPASRLNRFLFPGWRIGAYTGLRSRLTLGFGMSWPFMHSSDGHPSVSIDALCTGRGAYVSISRPLSDIYTIGFAQRIDNIRQSPSICFSCSIPL